MYKDLSASNLNKFYTSQSLPSRIAQARILIVEDQIFNLSIIVNCMTKAGFYNLECARDGKEGISVTHKFQPDLIILDLHMPELSGFGYLEYMTRNSNEPHIPIIVQTSADEREEKLLALTMADDFINKPVDPEELVLRARIQLQHYFLLQDFKEFSLSLQVEKVQTQIKIEDLKKANSAAK